MGKERLKIWELKAFSCQDLPSDQVNDPRNLISLFLPSPVPKMPSSCQLSQSLLCLKSQPVVKPQAQKQQQQQQHLKFKSSIISPLIHSDSSLSTHGWDKTPHPHPQPTISPSPIPIPAESHKNTPIKGTIFLSLSCT